MPYVASNRAQGFSQLFSRFLCTYIVFALIACSFLFEFVFAMMLYLVSTVNKHTIQYNCALTFSPSLTAISSQPFDCCVRLVRKFAVS